jgi:hypothetical protein
MVCFFIFSTSFTINGFKTYELVKGFKKCSIRRCAPPLLVCDLFSSQFKAACFENFGKVHFEGYRVLFGGMTALAMNKPPMIQATDSRTLNSAPNPAATPLA